MNVILEVKNLSKEYYTKDKSCLVIDNVSFNVYEGEIVTILGKSGCGKSTILMIIGNMLDKTSGSVIKDDDTNISIMFQKDSLLEYLTVYDNCILPLKINKIDTEDNTLYVRDLLNKYGLLEHENSFPRDLSGGMRQRVNLIRALSVKPKLLLLDEPFSALDEITRLTICDDVYNICRQLNTAVIMITHDIQEAISMSDKIIMINNQSIEKVYEINELNNDIPSNNRSTPYLVNLSKEIFKELNNYD